MSLSSDPDFYGEPPSPSPSPSSSRPAPAMPAVAIDVAAARASSATGVATASRESSITNTSRDAGSDVDMDVSSDDEQVQMPSNGTKRKLSEEATSPAPKKIKATYWTTAGRSSRNPDAKQALREAWFHIMLYLSPASLLAMKKLPYFDTLLTAVQPKASGSKKSGRKVAEMGSEDIWANARRVFCSNMPRPLHGLSDMAQFELIASTECSRCNKQGLPSSNVNNPLQTGPGANGVRVIWPFRVALCSDCLLADTVSVRDATPEATNGSDDQQQAGALQQFPRYTKALSEAYILQQGGAHYVLSVEMDNMRKNRTLPRNLAIQKFFYRKDITELQREEQNILQLGDGAHEGWTNGFDKRKEDAQKDVERWEKWERDQVGVGTDLSRKLWEYDHPLSSKSTTTVQSKFTGVPSTHASFTNAGKQSTTPIPSMYSPQDHSNFPSQFAPNPSLGTFPPSLPQRLPPRPSDAAVHSTHQMPLKRTAQDIERIKDERKQDIELRCMLLPNPIYPAELHQMKAFQDTMVIARPMDDAQWKALHPLLLKECPAPIKREYGGESSTMTLRSTPRYPLDRASSLPKHFGGPPIKLEQIKTPEQELKDHKEAIEVARLHLRYRLREFANEAIRHEWNDGRIKKSQLPHFAASVIQYIVKRFAECSEEKDFSTTLLLPSHGDRPPLLTKDDIYLTFGDMKWVYDDRIYPAIRDYNFDPFLCSRMKGASKQDDMEDAHSYLYVSLENDDCDPKWFPFDSLLQHWSSKHGDGDNVGTEWTAPWPDEPPFVTDPEIWKKHLPFEMRAPANTHSPRNQIPSKSKIHETPAERFEKELRAETADVEMRLSSVWGHFDGVAALPDAIRVQVAIYHACKEKDPKPDLELFTRVLIKMNPPAGSYSIKTPNNLHCKVCVGKHPQQRVKDYNISSLAAHFKLLHPEGDFEFDESGQYNPMFWRDAMVELPPDSEIRRYAQAVPDEVFDYYHQAFKEILDKAEPEPVKDNKLNSLASNVFKKGTQKKKKGSKKKKKGPEQPQQVPQEEQYDPTRPMLVPKDEDDDDARYDTFVRDQAQRTHSSALAEDASTGTPSVGRRSPSPERKNSTGALPQCEPSVAQMIAELTAKGVFGGPNVSAAANTSYTPHQQTREPTAAYPTQYAQDPRQAAASAIPDLQALLANSQPRQSAPLQPSHKPQEHGYPYPQQAYHQPQPQYYQPDEPVRAVVPQQAHHYSHAQPGYGEQRYDQGPRYVIDQYGRQIAVYPVQEYPTNGPVPPQNAPPNHAPQPEQYDPRHNNPGQQQYRYM